MLFFAFILYYLLGFCLVMYTDFRHSKTITLQDLIFLFIWPLVMLIGILASDDIIVWKKKK